MLKAMKRQNRPKASITARVIEVTRQEEPPRV